MRDANARRRNVAAAARNELRRVRARPWTQRARPGAEHQPAHGPAVATAARTHDISDATASSAATQLDSPACGGQPSCNGRRRECRLRRLAKHRSVQTHRRGQTHLESPCTANAINDGVSAVQHILHARNKETAIVDRRVHALVVMVHRRQVCKPTMIKAAHSARPGCHCSSSLQPCVCATARLRRKSTSPRHTRTVVSQLSTCSRVRKIRLRSHRDSQTTPRPST